MGRELEYFKNRFADERITRQNLGTESAYIEANLEMQSRSNNINQSNTDSIMNKSGAVYSSNKSKTLSILIKKYDNNRRTRKRVTFCEFNSISEDEHEEDKPEKEKEDFIQKVPKGSVKLSKEQRQKLIEILEGPASEDEDILLTLNKNQVSNLLKLNVAGNNVQIALDQTHLDILNNNSSANRRISVYPKNFFAMVEKSKLKGSRLSVYPENFFEESSFNKSKRMSVLGMRSKAVSVYPKDLFELVESNKRKSSISEYPQQMFDLLKAFGDYDIDEATRERVRSVYPKEFLEMAEKQVERCRDKRNTIYPKELFELVEEEREIGSRVSIYPKDLFKLLEGEARCRNMSVYPGDFFNMLNEEYGKVVELTPDQIKTVLKCNSGERDTQIVISSSQRNDLLEKLKEHRSREEQLERDIRDSNDDLRDSILDEELIEPFELDLEKNQVMDVLNQNCLVNGAEIELTDSQLRSLKNLGTIKHTIIGETYYAPY